MPLVILKVRFSIKAIVFIASVICLSWCFAGWRALQQGVTLVHCLAFVAAVATTALILGVQGYWIYFEEMEKGSLKRKVALFDRIHLWIEQRREKHS